jgi:Ca2+-binding RTX toxin-like protein
MAIIIGTDGPNDITSESAGDEIHGLGGNDILTAIGDNSTLDGGSGDDQLFSFGLGSTQIGGAGNDALNAGPGADVFKYSFTMTQGQGNTFTFTDFLSEKFGRDFGDQLPDAPVRHHHHDDDDHHHHRHHYRGHDDDDRHHAQGGGLTENFFEKNYKEWLKEVVVPDLLASPGVVQTGKIKIDINEDSVGGTPIIKGLEGLQLAQIFGGRDDVILRDGHETEKAFYSNSYTSPGGGQNTAASADGFDNIVNFDFTPVSGDKLEFSGLGNLTLAEFTSLFKVTVVDADNDGTLDDTRLALLDDSWAVSLLDDNGAHVLNDFHANIFA